MTLSLSVFVCSFVRPSLFFSFSVPVVSIVLKSFNGVIRMFKEYLKFKGSFKDVSRKF